MNFLEETMNALEYKKKSIKDVKFVMIGVTDFETGNVENGYIDKDEFFSNIDFEYDSGYGTSNINDFLKLVGDDWWLERHEYDGSEWWEFKILPTKPIMQVNHKYIDNDYAIQDELRELLLKE